MQMCISIKQNSVFGLGSISVLKSVCVWWGPGRGEEARETNRVLIMRDLLIFLLGVIL